MIPKREFIDDDHKVSREYYEILDEMPARSIIKRRMKELIERDPNFYDPYVVVADILEDEGKIQEARLYRINAYELAMKRIADKYNNLPTEMHWGFLENRHIMRALQNYARFVWRFDHNTQEALKVFRYLLAVNPNDNQGARYEILALRLGLDWGWEDKYTANIGGSIVVDPEPLEKWFNKNAKKFSEEFKVFWEYAESLE